VPPRFDVGAGLGPRLRQVREERGLSVRELARRIGCSASLVSQIERGLSAPSVGIVYAMATELRTSLDYLFGVDSAALADGNGHPPPDTGRPPRPGQRRGVVQRADARRIIDLASGVRWERLTPGRDSRTDFLEVVYSPAGHSTDERRPLRHDGHEYGVILSGRLQANIGLETHDLGPGDAISFDSSIPHEYRNTTDDDVRAIWVVVHTEPGRA
jgi:transcriptional regulator with XRE-family HTH domain